MKHTMNSKVIKWFIRHTGIRKADNTEQKKHSEINEGSETLRKFSLSRLSLRKRYKRRKSAKTEKEVTPFSLAVSNQIMLPIMDSDGKPIVNNVDTGHIYSNVPVNCLKHSTVKKRIISQSSADASFNRDNVISEKENCKRSSASLPEQFSFEESVELLSEVEDCSETSTSSSDSESTVKKVENLDEKFGANLTQLSSDGNESVQNNLDLIGNSATIKDSPNDIPNFIVDQTENKTIDGISSVDFGDFKCPTNISSRNSSLDSLTGTTSIEDEFNNNSVINECEYLSNDTKLESNLSEGIKGDNTSPTSIEAKQLPPINLCELNDILNISTGPHNLNDSDINTDQNISDSKTNNKITEQNSIQNDTITDGKNVLKENSVSIETKYNDVIDSKKQSLNSSIESLSKSNGHNETIAIFDDDGDISAISSPLEIENCIGNSQKNVENNVKQLKKLKFLCINNIKSRSADKCQISHNATRSIMRKPNSRDKFFADEIPTKIKIVITHPSPEKGSGNTHSQIELPLQNNLTFSSREQYPERLNPFGDDNPVCEPQRERIHQESKLQKNINKSYNPFGSDSEEEGDLRNKVLHSRQNGSREGSADLVNRRRRSGDNSKNPFAIYEAMKNYRLSATNPFADDFDDEKNNSEKYSKNIRITKEDTPPSLPPKLDYRQRQGSLSSTPVPHPRRSKQGYHGSSNSLNVSAFPPVPFPRSLVPSDSSETLNLSQDYEEIGRFSRGSSRNSLPVSSQVRFSKKKRIAPRPPNQAVTQRSVSSDRASLRRSDTSKSKDGLSISLITSSYQMNQPPPRPPPPKIQFKDYKPTIKEKCLRII